jgi:hypothetical protein
LRELVSKPSGILQANTMVASGPSLTRGPDANKKKKKIGVCDLQICSLNLGVVNKISLSIRATGTGSSHNTISHTSTQACSFNYTKDGI